VQVIFAPVAGLPLTRPIEASATYATVVIYGVLRTSTQCCLS